MKEPGSRDGEAQPTYWDMIEAALTFARGHAYNTSTSEMVEQALRAFDRVKEACPEGSLHPSRVTTADAHPYDAPRSGMLGGQGCQECGESPLKHTS